MRAQTTASGSGAPPVIELRPEPDAPRDLSSRLAALLSERMGSAAV